MCSAPMMLGQNTGDYVFTAGGLDNVITMVCMPFIHISHSYLTVAAVSAGSIYVCIFMPLCDAYDLILEPICQCSVFCIIGVC